MSVPYPYRDCWIQYTSADGYFIVVKIYWISQSYVHGEVGYKIFSVYIFYYYLKKISFMIIAGFSIFTSYFKSFKYIHLDENAI